MTYLTLFNPSFRRFFSDPFGDLPFRFGEAADGGALRAPPVDVRESDSEVVVEAELPGVPRENISVRYHDGRLVLETRHDGQRGEACEDTGKELRKAGDGAAGWLRCERVRGRFRRTFELPESVDASAIRAESRDGVLRVVLPKLEAAQPRQIEVSVH